jgi:hypothetical protein
MSSPSSRKLPRGFLLGAVSLLGTGSVTVPVPSPFASSSLSFLFLYIVVSIVCLRGPLFFSFNLLPDFPLDFHANLANTAMIVRSSGQ